MGESAALRKHGGQATILFTATYKVEGCRGSHGIDTELPHGDGVQSKNRRDTKYFGTDELSCAGRVACYTVLAGLYTNR